MTSSSQARPFEVVDGWEQLPEGLVHLDVADVAVDVQDNVYVLARKDPAVIVYDADGRFLRTWGSDVLSSRPHAITLGPDGVAYVVDEGSHLVRRFTPEGEQMGVIGTGVASETGVDSSNPSLYHRIQSIERGAGPFNRPTKVAMAPSGDLYVSDGYGNARVHQFTSDGELVRSWGEPGTGPGQFNLPHCVSVLSDGRVLVSDRENDRLQVFDPDGAFIEAWAGLQRPTATTVARDGLVYVLESGLWKGDESIARGLMEVDLTPRVSILDDHGTLLDRWGNVGDDPCAPGNLVAPHGLCIDSAHNLYIAEVSHTSRSRRGRDAENCHTFQKFAPVR
ncbi:peptidyl-alpha-hydroxyglycine alpha-amidating lyase family protein [Intrasporangium mesophilum]